MQTSGALKFEIGQECKIVYIRDVSSRDTLLNFATVLQGYTKAAIIRSSFSQNDDLENLETPGRINDIDLYAVIKMRNAEDKKLIAVIIPAPDFTMFENVPDRGYRVKTDVGQTITAAYQTMSGLTLTFENGWLCGTGP